MDVYVLPPGAAAGLIDAREKAFWVAKANGADDIIDVVVPRAAVPAFMARVTEIAAETGSWIAGCGHAGDGNVHMGVFQPDPEVRGRVLRALFAAGMALGGAISGEHGLGTEKAGYFLELEDPAKIALMRRIKAAFDPNGILNPGTILGRQRMTDTGPAELNGAQALIRTLVAAGVDTCFTNPGTSEMHFVAALDTVPEMRGVLALFEGVATGAADGYARMAGRPAATLLHLGPGAGQRPRQPAQRPQGPRPRRQHRRRPRHLPQAVRRPARERHRDGRPQRVALGALVAHARRRRRDAAEAVRRRRRAPRARWPR